MGPPTGVAFLLAQLGAHASARFTERVAELDLTPAHVGVLRLVAQHPGSSQQLLAAQLHVAPSRVVGLVDDLEARELLERRRDTADRRQYALRLAPGAERHLARIRDVVTRHDQELTDGLTPQERDDLAALLRKLADAQGLSPHVHPGYRNRPAPAQRP
ncbi:MAG: hypothetical protein JWO60_354 [Frankiales bacterium]|nr:hypothetical protein [Frankiales bacterium]